MIKLQSLKQGKQFSEIFKKGKIISNYFTVYFEKNLNKKSKIKNLNISFVIKKKIGNSVKRNKIKRKLKAAIQKNLKQNNVINLNYAYLVLGKKNLYKDKFSLIFNDVNNVFKKIK